ncbi:hypothetical protein ASPWEDRAFT_136662 [Aspergillus wentii DTO 134E9]|uniref:Carboxylic ester hydrolase n=1 Tax=Aspergillus wentii DTO 134E9 TaxID=1073089 RepID=A0A1L9RHW8_ASPWE|nr:uncharacterized protein ASPWEDRAFT_136662 [Aspergillus wentii DTO 134E9]OJJ34514.1 hypothetical protein ASPWEDRAFT_136662 [Aspergillus wentii DTO 134E9]
MLKLLILASLPAIIFHQQLTIYTLPYLPTSVHPYLPLPLTTLPQGILIGKTLKQDLKTPIDAFLGIPYAVSPVGERRFRPAVPVPAGEGVVDAREFGPRCPGKQLLQVTGDVKYSEDCLTVNVFRPSRKDGGKKLPVAVYVHGGAYNRGTSSMHNTASMISWSEEPFIGVSFNYRIGALGFLPSTLSAEEGILNLGLRDQIVLLQWVQDNIESFGGDPSQVTVFGLSAGAHSIAHHIMNTDLPPLFHRAIIESGSATSRAVHPYNARLHEDQFNEFISLANCTTSKDHIMSCLRSAQEPVILNASYTVFAKYNPSVRWAFQPVIDGDLIKQRPIDAWKSGKWQRMPIITGFNTNEGTYYVPSTVETSEQFDDFFKTLLPAYSSQDIQTISNLYPDPLYADDSPYIERRNIPVGPQYKRLEAAYGHYAYACPVRQTASLASQDQNAPIFLYHWALNKTVQGGANHGDQMAYETFNPEVRSISPSQREMAGTLHAYFTSFIVTGDPNKFAGMYADRPQWNAYGAERKEKIMLFGEGNDERAGGDGKGVIAQMKEDEWSRKECDFWWTKAGISDVF